MSDLKRKLVVVMKRLVIQNGSKLAMKKDSDKKIVPENRSQDVHGNRNKKSIIKTRNLEKHIEKNYCDIDRKFKCALCHKSFIRKDHVKTHIKVIHEGIKPFICKICETKFPNKSEKEDTL